MGRVAGAEREGWAGGVEGLRVSLAGAEDKLTYMDRHAVDGTLINVGMPRVTPVRPIRAEEGMAVLGESVGDHP